MIDVIEELNNVIQYCQHVGYTDGVKFYTRILCRYVLTHKAAIELREELRNGQSH